MGNIQSRRVFYLIGTLGLSGCMDFPSQMRIGGYEHVDMSASQYQEVIEKKAYELSDSEREQDKKNAARLFGSIGNLEEMDSLLIENFNKDPGMGLLLLREGDKIHEYYKEKNKK
jgi:hypothetical protein